MQIIPTVSRHQMGFSSLDCLISTDNEVRLIDAFVEKLDMNKLGFYQRIPQRLARTNAKLKAALLIIPKCF